MGAQEKQNHAEEERRVPETDKRGSGMNGASRWWRDPAHVIQSIGIGIGTIVAIIYGGQLFQMIKSNNLTRESLTEVQRAFVSFERYEVSAVEVPSPTGNDLEWRFKSRLENSGTTPAINVVAYFQLRELAAEPDEGMFKGKISHEPTNIGPKGQSEIGPIPKSYSFLPSPKQNTANPIFAWGWIMYRDIFPGTKVHLTEYSSQLDTVVWPKPGGGHPAPNEYPIPQLTWIFNGPHNCTDENCKDYETMVDMLKK